MPTTNRISQVAVAPAAAPIPPAAPLPVVAERNRLLEAAKWTFGLVASLLSFGPSNSIFDTFITANALLDNLMSLLRGPILNYTEDLAATILPVFSSLFTGLSQHLLLLENALEEVEMPDLVDANEPPANRR